MSTEATTSRQFRVRWRNWNRDPFGGLHSHLRYEHRESMEAAERVVAAVSARQEEDYCECQSDCVECGYCSGQKLPPTSVEVFSRPVGTWAAEPFE